MIEKIGILEIFSALEHLDVLAPATASALKAIPSTEDVGIAEIDAVLSDTAAFCQRYQVPLSKAANCVILEAKRAERTWYAACVILGSTRIDVNGAARKFLGARRVSFAPIDTAVKLTGMEYGAITPIGVPPEWPILIDRAVASSGRT